MKAELLGRIFSARSRTLLGFNPGDASLAPCEWPDEILALLEFPSAYLHGPLEGGVASRIELPPAILERIEKELSSDVLQPSSFIVVGEIQL